MIKVIILEELQQRFTPEKYLFFEYPFPQFSLNPDLKIFEYLNSEYLKIKCKFNLYEQNTFISTKLTPHSKRVHPQAK